MVYLVTNNPDLCSTEDFEIISIKESLEKLNPLQIVGLDTETSGIDVHSKDLLLVQMGCYEFQVVIDCRTIDILEYKEFLESDRLFIGWNLKFDIKFFLKYGILVQNIWDGYLAERLRWVGFPAGMHSLSLKSAGEQYLNIELDKTVRGQIIWQKTLTPEVIKYGANDVKYLEKIREKQIEALGSLKLNKALAFENKFCPVLAYTEFCGVKLDINRWKAKMIKDQERFNKAKENLDQWVVDYYLKHNGINNLITLDWTFEKKLDSSTTIKRTPPPCDYRILEPHRVVRTDAETLENKAKILIDFPYITINYQGDLFTGFDTAPKCTLNWSSPKQVTPFLELLGFNLETYDKVTKQKKKSVGADVIEGQLDISPISKVYLEYKACEKLIGTYGQNILDQVNPNTGRIYTNFNQCGADTLRLSSGGKDKENRVDYVNFQNFPADPETRACFIAEKGYKWISCDYSAQESRIIADVANDKAMLDLFNHGCGDVHSLVAKMAYKSKVGDCPVEQIKTKFKHWRQEAKGVEFAINYGGDANTIQSNKKIPLEEAQKIYNDYMEGFPGVKTYQDLQRKFVMQYGYIILNDKTQAKAFIYDFGDLLEIRKKFNNEFWETYREFKKNNPESTIVEEVKHYFKRKSASEKQAINYKIQGTGAAMFKLASIYLFDYIVKHDLLFKVKLCIPAHDEWNIEVPEEISQEMAQVLQDCMKRSGAYFCTKIELPAEAEVADCWIH